MKSAHQARKTGERLRREITAAAAAAAQHTNIETHTHTETSGFLSQTKTSVLLIIMYHFFSLSTRSPLVDSLVFFLSMKANATGAKRVKLKVRKKEKSCPKTAAAAALYWFIVFSFAVRNEEKNECMCEGRGGEGGKRKTTEKTSFADRFSSLLKEKTSN